MDPPNPDLEYAISQIEALGWEDPSPQLEAVSNDHIQSGNLALIGKIVALKFLKPPNGQSYTLESLEFCQPFFDRRAGAQ